MTRRVSLLCHGMREGAPQSQHVGRSIQGTCHSTQGDWRQGLPLPASPSCSQTQPSAGPGEATQPRGKTREVPHKRGQHIPSAAADLSFNARESQGGWEKQDKANTDSAPRNSLFLVPEDLRNMGYRADGASHTQSLASAHSRATQSLPHTNQSSILQLVKSGLSTA